MEISSDDTPEHQYPFLSEEEAWQAIHLDREFRGELCRSFRLVPRRCDKPAEPDSSAALADVTGEVIGDVNMMVIGVLHEDVSVWQDPFRGVYMIMVGGELYRPDVDSYEGSPEGDDGGGVGSDEGAENLEIPRWLYRGDETGDDAMSDDGTNERLDDLYWPPEAVQDDGGARETGAGIGWEDESSGYLRAGLGRYNHTFMRMVNRAIDLWCALFDRDNNIYVQRKLARARAIALSEGRLLGQGGGTSVIWTVRRAEYVKQLELSKLCGNAPPSPAPGWESVAECDQCKTFVTSTGITLSFVHQTESDTLFCDYRCCNTYRLLSRLRAEPGQSIVCFNEECAETISLDGAGFSGAAAVGGKKNGGLYCPRCAAAKDKATTTKKDAKDKATRAKKAAANLKAHGPCGAVTIRGKCGRPASSLGGLCTYHQAREREDEESEERRCESEGARSLRRGDAPRRQVRPPGVEQGRLLRVPPQSRDEEDEDE